MKKLAVFALIAGLAIVCNVEAQVKPNLTANNHPSPPKSTLATTGTRTRVLGSSIPTSRTAAPTSTPAQNWGHAPMTGSAEQPRQTIQTVSPSNIPKANPTATGAGVVNASGVSTQIYRVGVGDILDIQIPDSLNTRSTLYTITADGLLDYPLAGRAFPVSGLTTEAIAARLKAAIKVLNNPPIIVKVRDYASHTVNVIGFVSLPGAKVLRREAVPLYVVLAEAMPLSEAGSVAVVRNGQEAFVANLRDTNAASQLVISGDVIKVLGTAAVAPDYFFAGGEVNAPGQKVFHAGLTLTQAILASGGTSRNASTQARVSRQSADGRLVNFDYNLQNIRLGKSPDPVLQKGDRIEVSRN